MDPQTNPHHGLYTKPKRQGHPHTSSKINYRQAVLTTLAFFDLFQYPLTKEETHRYLFQLESDAHHIEIALNECNLIEKRGSYYQLAQEKKHIQTRHERELISKQLWKKVDRFRTIFALTPYLRLVAVCNNLAYNNASENSDIDLFVITKPGRMFISRLILTTWLHLFGVRRHGKKIAGRFCLSFFTTENQLNFDTIKKTPLDIYLAYWFQTLQPIYGETENYLHFLELNHSWLSQVFAAPIRPQMDHFKKNPTWTKILKNWQEKLFDTRWGETLEEKLANWQLKRARTKRTKLGLDENDSAIVLSKNMLKFHNIDKRELIYQNWIERIQSLLKR